MRISSSLNPDVTVFPAPQDDLEAAQESLDVPFTAKKLFQRQKFERPLSQASVDVERGRPSLPARLRHIVTCIGPNQKNQPNLDLYLVRRYKICHFPMVVSYLCIGQNQKNQFNLVLYLVHRSKIFVSAATLQ